nr:immunoglobulin heavy chain junction region [Macaca mulatta]MOW99820.1 immunoglobulin heavy chain junction region [Macaca mulatta]MOX00145.1 immunoglobulin heavy chain junction region [Macaca mulatta]MOX00256.1 immunoglobulin heavy chain junction region [Macaca mulatta]MOX02556.1 immunoglobulin heavy chain junction region [Macaca mulatta]
CVKDAYGSGFDVW